MRPVRELGFPKHLDTGETIMHRYWSASEILALKDDVVCCGGYLRGAESAVWNVAEEML